MTAVSPPQPLTTMDLLFGDDSGDGADALARALREQGALASLGRALGQVSEAGREAAEREIGTVAHRLLDLDLAGLVVAGWRKHAELTAATERTTTYPGSSVVVPLATHRITAAYQPFVGLLVNEVRMATVRFDLRVVFLVGALVATVRNGHLASLGAGTCEVTGTLAAAGVQLLTRQRHLDLPLLVHLPLRIDHDEPEPSAAAPSRTRPPAWLPGRPVHQLIGRRHRRQPAQHTPPAD